MSKNPDSFTHAIHSGVDAQIARALDLLVETDMRGETRLELVMLLDGIRGALNGRPGDDATETPLSLSAGDPGDDHIARLHSEIADRKRAEVALRRSETRYRMIVENSRDGIWLLNADGIGVYVNNRMAEMLGYTPEEMLGKTFSDFMDFADGVEAESLIRRTREEPCEMYDFRLLRKDGSAVWTIVTMSIVPEDEGESEGALAMVTDISDRKRAEEAVRESEARFRIIFEHAPVMMHSIDESGCFSSVNAKWLKELGYTRAEVIGAGVESIMTPDSAKTAAKAIARFWKTGEARNLEYQYMKKDGAIMDAILNCVSIPEPSGKRVSLTVISDVTEQKRAESELRRSEERFRAIIESAVDCIFVTDRTLRYTHVNPAMERLLDLPASQILGRNDDEIFGRKTAAELYEVSSRVLKGEFVEQEHTRLIRGVPMTFHDIRAPLKDGSGKIVGVCGISRDVTERRKSEPVELFANSDEFPSPAMRNTLAKARLAAVTDTIILLLGESGVGKDYLARYIHDHSKRANGPFFSINCAAVALNLAESELFGHEAGSFTGATSRKRGLLELAEGGTLLLNEIGELSLRLQAKLLTFLDTRSFTRVGGETNIPVNARLIAATNRDLAEEVEAGRFRSDLFYRLNVLSITVPPLRERSEDLPLLVRSIVEQVTSEMQLPHSPVVDTAGLKALSAYHWPGNVRELRNVLERSLILSGKGRISLGSLGLGAANQGEWSFSAGFPEKGDINAALDDFRRALIHEALARTKGNKQAAADLLGISRFALFRLMKSTAVSEQ